MGSIWATLTRHLLTPEYRAELFRNDLHMSDDILYRQSCQHNGNWKCVDRRKDRLRSKAHVKNRENICAAHALQL